MKNLKISDLEITSVRMYDCTMIIDWSANIGFGQYTIYRDDNGVLCAETECLDTNQDRTFSKMLFDKFVESLRIVE